MTEEDLIRIKEKLNPPRSAVVPSNAQTVPDSDINSIPEEKLPQTQTTTANDSVRNTPSSQSPQRALNANSNIEMGSVAEDNIPEPNGGSSNANKNNQTVGKDATINSKNNQRITNNAPEVEMNGIQEDILPQQQSNTPQKLNQRLNRQQPPEVEMNSIQEDSLPQQGNITQPQKPTQQIQRNNNYNQDINGIDQVELPQVNKQQKQQPVQTQPNLTNQPILSRPEVELNGVQEDVLPQQLNSPQSTSAFVSPKPSTANIQYNQDLNGINDETLSPSTTINQKQQIPQRPQQLQPLQQLQPQQPQQLQMQPQSRQTQYDQWKQKQMQMILQLEQQHATLLSQQQQTDKLNADIQNGKVQMLSDVAPLSTERYPLTQEA